MAAKEKITLHPEFGTAYPYAVLAARIARREYLGRVRVKQSRETKRVTVQACHQALENFWHIYRAGQDASRLHAATTPVEAWNTQLADRKRGEYQSSQAYARQRKEQVVGTMKQKAEELKTSQHNQLRG